MKTQTQEALEQPSQEPVAWMDTIYGNLHNVNHDDLIPLYTHPAPSWQGLSDDEMNEIFEQVCGKYSRLNAIDIDFIRAIEQALRNKNGY